MYSDALVHRWESWDSERLNLRSQGYFQAEQGLAQIKENVGYCYWSIYWNSTEWMSKNPSFISLWWELISVPAPPAHTVQGPAISALNFFFNSQRPAAIMSPWIWRQVPRWSGHTAWPTSPNSPLCRLHAVNLSIPWGEPGEVPSWRKCWACKTKQKNPDGQTELAWILTENIQNNRRLSIWIEGQVDLEDLEKVGNSTLWGQKINPSGIWGKAH